MLTDLIPAKHRKFVYGLATLAALVVAAWQGANGDWVVFSEALFGAMITGLAHQNTAVSSDETPGEDGAVNIGGPGVTFLVIMVCALAIFALLGHPIRVQ